MKITKDNLSALPRISGNDTQAVAPMAGAFLGSSPITSNSGLQATIWFHPPMQFGQQAIRPYVYQVDDNMVDRIASHDGRTDSLIRRELTDPNSPFLKAVRPEANFIGVNMTPFHDCWTFTLMLDIPSGNNAAGVIGPVAAIRLVASGWCQGIPVGNCNFGSAMNGNPDCVLVTTSMMHLRIGDRLAAMGSTPQRTALSSDDMFGKYVAQLASKDLLVCTPGDILNTVASTADDGGLTGSYPILANLGEKAPSVQISNAHNSPVHNISGIIRSLDSAIDMNVADEYAMLNNMTGGFDSSYMQSMDESYKINKIRSEFTSNVRRSYGISTSTIGLDLTKPITLGELDSMYGGRLVVNSFNTASTYQHDVIPQNIITAQTTYSSMVGSAISAFANNCGVSSIAFYYSSYNPKGYLGGADPIIRVHYSAILAPDTNETIKDRQVASATQAFMMMITDELAPILKVAGGEFELNIKYDIATQTLVDLHFLDYGGRYDKAYYTFDNRVNFTSPMLGDIQVFNNNGVVLNNMATNVIRRKTGVNMPFDCTGEPMVVNDGTSLFGDLAGSKEPAVLSIPSMANSNGNSLGF